MLPLRLFIAMLLGSLPLMAVVTHQRDKKEPQPSFAAAVPSSDSLILYDKDGTRVAFCHREPVSAMLQNCKVEPGETFDDVMNAWLRAYEDR